MAPHKSLNYRKLLICNVLLASLGCLLLVALTVRSLKGMPEAREETASLSSREARSSARTGSPRPFRIYRPGQLNGPASHGKVQFGREALAESATNPPEGPPPELIQGIERLVAAGQLEPMRQQQEAELKAMARRQASDDQDNRLDEERVKALKQRGAVAW